MVCGISRSENKLSYNYSVTVNPKLSINFLKLCTAKTIALNPKPKAKP